MNLLRKLYFQVLAIFSFIILKNPLSGQWSSPIAISPTPSSVNIGTSVLVINSYSNGLVGWLNGTIGVAQSLFSASLAPDSTTWTSPEHIYTNTAAGFFPSFPTMARSLTIPGMDSAAFAILDGMTFSTSEIQASRRDSTSSTWPTPLPLSLNAIIAVGITVSGELGNLIGILATTTTGAPPFDIVLIQLLRNKSDWLPIIVLDQVNTALPVIAGTTFYGKQLVAWKAVSPSLQIKTQLFNSSLQTFSEVFTVPLPPSTTDVVGAFTTASSTNNAVILFAPIIGGKTLLYTSTLLKNGNINWSNLSNLNLSWSDPLLISNPANDIIHASIDSDFVGNATILWAERIAANQDFVRAATLPLNGNPTFVTDLTDNAPVNATVTNLQVKEDSFGNAVAIWAITTAAGDLVQVSAKPAGGNWTTPETLSTTGNSAVIALSNQGTAIATWIDTGTGILMGSRNLFLFPLNPPTRFFGEKVTNEFLTQTNYALQVTWFPSLAPHIVNYQIFENGTLIGTVLPNDPLEFTIPLNSQNVENTYTLVAEASNGNKSTPLPLVVKN